MSLRIAYVLGTILLLVGALAGCKEKDVPFVVDEDELIRYIEETTEGRQLFRTDCFVVSEDYGFPFDNGVYLDSLVKHERTYDIRMTGPDESEWVNYGALGDLREAHVFVQDRFTIQTMRDYDDLGIHIVDTTVREVERLAFFLKLGDDSEEYVGWVLWGFNGIFRSGPEASVRLRRFDGSVFPGDYSAYLTESRDTSIGLVAFRRLDQLDTVVVGSRLVVTMIYGSSTSDPSVFSLSGLDTSGMFIREMAVDDTVHIDTVRTIQINPPRYNVLFVSEYVNDRFRYRRSWCIPFRM